MSTKQERKEIYGTRRWRMVRTLVLRKSGWLCETCKAQSLTCAAEEVHHKTPIREGGAPFDEANLVALCRNCHDEVHNRKNPINPSYEAWKAFRDKLNGVNNS